MNQGNYQQMGPSLTQEKLYKKMFLIINFVIILYQTLVIICMIKVLTSDVMSQYCSNYLIYFILFVCGSAFYLIGCLSNVFGLFKSFANAKVQRFLGMGLLAFLLGAALKIGFVIYSIIIYDRNYGDCYFYQNLQLALLLESIFEFIFMLIFQSSTLRNEKRIVNKQNFYY